eukprot:scaffold3198_cov213-Alexandrium_tamarense.AAC.32
MKHRKHSNRQFETTAQAQCSGASDSDIQRAPHFSIGRRLRRLSNTSMGRVATTNCTHPQSTQAIKCGTNRFSICISSWQFRLQSDAPGTLGLRSPVSQ